MARTWYLFFLATCITRFGISEENVGPGLWNVINIAPCDLSEDNVIQTNISKRTIRRGQDGFSGSISLGVDLTESMSMTADICKEVDGGCKPFMVMKDDSFCKFMKEYMFDLFEELLLSWGVDPPDCPVKKDMYTVSDYPFNYKRLKKDAVYGVFETIASISDGNTEVLCIKVIASFTKTDGDDDDDDDDE